MDDRLFCCQCGTHVDTHDASWHLDQWVYIDVAEHEPPPFGHAIPLYSSDIEDAMQIIYILEHNHADEILFSCSRKGTDKTTVEWHVTFRKCKGNQHDYHAKGITLELAI